MRFDLGLLLAGLGRHAEAAQRFAEAIQLSPGLAQAHFLRGVELGKLDKPAEAEPEFREAARLMPDLVEARLNLGISLYQQQKWAEALETFEQALQRDPTNTVALTYVQALRSRTTGSSAK